MDVPNNSDPLLTYVQAAEWLAVSLRQFRRFVDSSVIPVVRISPRTPRIRSSDIRAFIAGKMEKQRNTETK